MITQSSNSAATTLWDEVGISNIQRFLNQAGMGQTILNHEAWGLTLITAHDELRLLQLLTARIAVLERSVPRLRAVADGAGHFVRALGRVGRRAIERDRPHQERLAPLPR